MEGENELIRALGRMEGKMDALITAHAATNARVDKQDERLSGVERKQWYHSGIVAAGVFALSHFTGILPR